MNRKGIGKMEKPPEHWKCNGEVHENYVMIPAKLGALRLILASAAKENRISENAQLRIVVGLALADMGDFRPEPALPGAPALHSRLPPEQGAAIRALVEEHRTSTNAVLRGLVARGLAILPNVPDPHGEALQKYKEALKQKHGDWSKPPPPFLGGAQAIEDFLRSLK